MSAILRWERVQALFRDALEQPPAVRDRYLSTACHGDESLRREVASLLAAHDAAGAFLETPALRLDDEAGASRWALQPGQRVGAFEVIAPLGAGGMGEVYRARDAALGREVAVKLLPPAFAANRERLARFERESRILASLNHPNIAAIHSIEHVDDLRLLVLELVEGPTLADRLSAGPLPLREALGIARQLADGLEAAHERSIVHRDLKPANVKVSFSGRVILLDFGLAKEHVSVGKPDGAGPQVAEYSSAGLILGTCAYMSPEQARGQSVDKRTDIWAFGCILFELLSGRRTFHGDTPAETIAAVLERQPDWSLLPAALPAGILRLLRRCLEKDPERRLHDIADARLEIDDAQPAEDGEAADRQPHSRKRNIGVRFVVRFVIAALAAAACVAVGWWVRGLLVNVVVDERPTRFTWSIPPGLRLESPPVISPDGRHIAFTASAEKAASLLYVRSLSAVDFTEIARSEGAGQPFWSPDSRTLAYFARGKLMKVAIDGGAPVEICAAGNPRGGTWGANGMIVFAPGSIDVGLSRVSANGGVPEPITVLDTAHGENAHRWPAFLPDGTHFLYFVRSIRAERRGVYIGRVDRPASLPGAALLPSESEAVYAPLDDSGRGLLLTVASGYIVAHPFDSVRRTLSGDPRTLPIAAGGNTPHHASTLTVSAGVLAHLSSSLPFGQRLVSTSSTGGELQFLVERGIVSWPRVSPDGSRLVSQQLDAMTGSPDLWVIDLQRGARLRVTKEQEAGQLPVWSPDGTKLAYVAGTLQKPVVTIAAADGTGALATLKCPRFRCEPTDWSRDGRWLLVNVLNADGGSGDVWMLSTEPGGAQQSLLAGSFAERDARFSPDGELLAYVSLEVGRPEISLRTVDTVRPRREVVSAGGGTQPVWSPPGTELYFVDPEGWLRVVTVRTDSDRRIVVGNPQRVDSPPIGTGHYGTQYDVSPDGQRVYFLDRPTGDARREIGVVLGWRALLQ